MTNPTPPPHEDTTLPPHEDTTLPPQLREALAIMARRGPVVELTVGPDGTPAPKTTDPTTAPEESR
nr:hypothetical protein [Streptomyces chartreusis]